MTAPERPKDSVPPTDPDSSTGSPPTGPYIPAESTPPYTQPPPTQPPPANFVMPTDGETARSVRRLGRYRLEGVLGRGGMGVVYLGQDEILDRPVAVKVIRPRSDRLVELTRGTALIREAFAAEARIGARLNHPALATVFDFGFEGDEPYIVFEYVGGETLSDTLARRGRIPLDEARLILAPLAQALQAAHAAHVVHRDLKPANIRSTEYGQYKILDMGLARQFREEQDWHFAGTPAYASPEQAAGLPCDGRTDQYALGLIAFELLAGRRVFEGKDIQSLLRAHQHDPPPLLREVMPDVPEGVSAAVARALSKNPNDRFDSCERLAAALGCQFLTDVRPQRIDQSATADRMRGVWRQPPLQSVRGGNCANLILAGGCVWVESRNEFRRYPAAELTDTAAHGRWLALGTPRGPLFLRLVSEQTAATWVSAIRSAAANPPVAADAEQVVLVPSADGVRYQTLGPLDCTAPDRRLAAVGLVVQASVAGAHAVIDGGETYLPDPTGNRWRRTGTAVQAVNAAGRRDLLGLWFAGRIDRSFRWSSLALVVAAVVVISFVAQVITMSMIGPIAEGKSPNLWFVIAGQYGPSVTGIRQVAARAGLGVWFLTPLVLVAWLRWTRDPRLLGPAVVAVAASSCWQPAESLLLLAFHSVRNTLGQLSQSDILWIFNPLTWAYLLGGLKLVRGGWRLRQQFWGRWNAIPDPLVLRRGESRLAWWVVGVYLTVLIGLTGDGLAGLARRELRHPHDENVRAARVEIATATARLESEPAAARDGFRRAILALDTVPPDHPETPVLREMAAACAFNVGLAELNLQDPNAVSTIRHAIERYEQLPPDVRWKTDNRRVVATARLELANQAVQNGRYAEAVQEGASAEELLRPLIGDPTTAEVRQLAVALHGVGLANEGKLTAAEEALARAAELFLADRPTRPIARRIEASTYVQLALVRYQLRGPAEARAAAEQAVRLFERLQADDLFAPSEEAGLTLARSFLREPLPAPRPGR
jgi:tRNA A-37 threonylcarbamoyl transferase component Bud32/tetratricopeptide (TPR) repeat protein